MDGEKWMRMMKMAKIMPMASISHCRAYERGCEKYGRGYPEAYDENCSGGFCHAALRRELAGLVCVNGLPPSALPKLAFDVLGKWSGSTIIGPWGGGGLPGISSAV